MARRTSAKANSPTPSRRTATRGRAKSADAQIVDAVMATPPAHEPAPGDHDPFVDATLLPAALPINFDRSKPIKLLPIVEELFILTKEMQVLRLGDIMNYAQRDFIARCERQLATKGQIRIVVLKARQIGISTVIEAICFALSMLFDNFKSLIVAHEDKASTNILAMTRRYWETYVFGDFHEERYGGQKHLAWDNKSDITIATAKNVGAGRSQTIHFLHASEVAFWPDGETLMTGLNQSIPTFGLNAIFKESTANGVGNYFHKQVVAAMKGDSDDEFCFYPWHEHPEYTAAYLPHADAQKYALDHLDEEERVLRDKYGVDDGRLTWRRWAIVNRCNNDVNQFHQEYPTTPHEAFISTGRNVFHLPHLIAHYDPKLGVTGRLLRGRGGKVQFVADPTGYLTIFAEPSPDRDWGVYLAGADPTHTIAGDYACIQIINRRTMEQVAVYRRKLDPISFGKDLLLVGEFYNNALIAPEKEGPGYGTVGVLAAHAYPNVYASQNITKMQGKPTQDLLGWSTNSSSKPMAVSHVVRLLSEPLAHLGGQSYGLLIHDERTLLEMRDYVTTKDGHGYENSDGSEYDDGVMALAIAVAVHFIEPPPMAYEEVQEHLLPPRVAPVRTGITSGTARPIDRVNERESRPIEAADPVGPDDVDEPDEAPWEAWGRKD